MAVDEIKVAGVFSTCPNCGKEFPVVGKKKWCSRKCRDAYQHRARRRINRCETEEERETLRKEFYEKRVTIERHITERVAYPIFFTDELEPTALGGKILEIPISGKRGGVVAIVDDTPRNRKLLKYNFINDYYGYPIASLDGAPVHLHHLVLGFPPDGFVVDHINHDKLDARLENLRFVRRGENNYNTGLRSDNSTGVTGVYYEHNPKKGRPFWYARIGKDGKNYDLGHYSSFEDAVAARKEAEIALYGYCLPGHKNSSPTDNRPSNLRVVSRKFNRSRKENSRRRGSRRNRSSWGL